MQAKKETPKPVATPKAKATETVETVIDMTVIEKEMAAKDAEIKALKAKLKGAEAVNVIEWEKQRYTVNMPKFLKIFDDIGRGNYRHIGPLQAWHIMAEVLGITADDAKKIMSTYHAE